MWDVRLQKMSPCEAFVGSNAAINSIEFDLSGSLLLASCNDSAGRLWTIWWPFSITFSLAGITIKRFAFGTVDTTGQQMKLLFKAETHRWMHPLMECIYWSAHEMTQFGCLIDENIKSFEHSATNASESPAIGQEMYSTIMMHLLQLAVMMAPFSFGVSWYVDILSLSIKSLSHFYHLIWISGWEIGKSPLRTVDCSLRQMSNGIHRMQFLHGALIWNWTVEMAFFVVYSKSVSNKFLYFSSSLLIRYCSHSGFCKLNHW